MKLLLFLVGIYALITYQCLTRQEKPRAVLPKPQSLPVSQPITKATLDTVFVRSMD